MQYSLLCIGPSLANYCTQNKKRVCEEHNLCRFLMDTCDRCETELVGGFKRKYWLSASLTITASLVIPHLTNSKLIVNYILNDNYGYMLIPFFPWCKGYLESCIVKLIHMSCILQPSKSLKDLLPDGSYVTKCCIWNVLMQISFPYVGAIHFIANMNKYWHEDDWTRLANTADIWIGWVGFGL